MKKIILASFICSIFLLGSAPAFAAKPSTGGGPKTADATLGNDVSYPQCGSRLPSGQAFAVVGVNEGLANTTNPCLADQLAWAQTSSGATSQPKVALYVNTANPGLAATVWPSSNNVDGTTVNKYGTCNHEEGAACAYVYGWTRAYEDATGRGITNPETYTWWLDVETTNSWSDTDYTANVASLEGMRDYFGSIQANVGIYSTSSQWNTIVGTLPASSSLNNLNSWLAGALTKRGAEANCKDAPLTVGGTVTLAQYVSKGIDYDVSCQ